MPRIREVFAAATLIAVFGLAPAVATEEIDHYEAKPSRTLEEAVANFIEYNAKLAAIMAREDLTVADMEEIHQLTYTLEVALAKINDVMQALPVTLEELHLASESHNVAKVRGVGSVYLENAQTAVPSRPANE